MSRPRGYLQYELMFDYKQTLTDRLTDAADLIIDFATLGEYGLEEPAGRTSPSCETRHRATPAPCTGPRRRGGERLMDRAARFYAA
jgi:hypothetical protein